MGMTWTYLTQEELCDLMCGDPEMDYEEEDDDKSNRCENGEQQGRGLGGI